MTITSVQNVLEKNHDIKFWRPQEDRRLYSGVDYVMNSKLFRLLPVCQLLCIQ
jgi:hypothetical protein